MLTGFANSISAHQNIMLANLELKVCVAQDLSISNGNTKVLDDYLHPMSTSTRKGDVVLTSFSALSSIASLWKRLCCAVTVSMVPCISLMLRSFCSGGLFAPEISLQQEK